jgi:serine/threonine-protein kinase HipA
LTAAADVYRGVTLAGRIERTKHGSVFEYDAGYLRAPASGERGIAFNLPYAARRFETVGVNLHTFFAGLLPEGLRLNALVKRVKTSPDDLLSLLIAAGADCVGDISVVKSGGPVGPTSPSIDVEKLDELSFAKVLERTLRVPRELGIPGVQEKVSAGVISVPVRGTRARAYLLKMTPRDAPRLVENEHFFMTMARACKIETAEVRLVRDREGASGLLVTRFDRVAGGGGKLHQEDACQLLDRYPADKYRLTAREVMEALSVCSAPIVAGARLLRLWAFSYLIGNGDLHGKNVSVQTMGGLTQLTPAYDVLTTLPYGDTHMALKIDGRDAKLDRAAFVRFGERFDVPRAATETMLDELVELSGPFVARVGEIGWDDKTTNRLARVIELRRLELAR